VTTDTQVAAAARERGSPSLRWRIAIVAASVVASALTWLDYRAFVAWQRELLELTETPEVTEVVARGLDETVRRETDLDRTAAGIARLLVFSEIGLGESETAPVNPELSQSRIELVRDLGAASLRERPTMESAAVAVGAANYLLLRRAEDRRLVAQPSLWETPLELARVLRQRGDGGRILAVAYLELWPYLSAEKRELARGLLADAFRDQRLFARVIEVWLDIEGDRDSALEVVPDRVTSWTFLERLYGSRRDWEAFAYVVDRKDQAVRREAERTLERAALLRRRGQVGRAREEYVGLLIQLEPTRENALYIERALAQAPATPPLGARRQVYIRGWLEWAVALCRSSGCPLTPQAIARLRGLADDVPEPIWAMAALYGERPTGQEREITADRTSPAWADYNISRARQLAQNGQASAASSTLANVSAGAGPFYWLARRDVARASGDANGLELAELELARFARDSWPESAWTTGPRVDGVKRLDFLVARAATRLVTTLEAPQTGAAAEIRLDGARKLLVVVEGRKTVTIEAPLAEGMHTIEIYSRGGGVVSSSEMSLGY
jgi:hypothetical protein